MRNILLAVATLLAFCGCSDKKGAESSATLRPKVPDGALVAVGANLSGERAIEKLVRDVERKLSENKEINALIKDGIGEVLTEGFGAAYEFLRETGLGELNVDWVVLSGNCKTDVKSMRYGLAVAGKNDLDGLMGKLKASVEKEGGDFPFEKSTLGARSVWHIKPSEIREDDPDLIVTSLDGKLMLVGVGEASLQELIDLYEGGAKVNSAFGDNFPTENQAFALKIANAKAVANALGFPLDREIERNGMPKAMMEFAQIKSASLEVMKSGAMSMQVEFDTLAAAKNVHAVVNGYVAIAKMQMTDEVPAFVQNVIDSIKVEIVGKQLVISSQHEMGAIVPFGIFGAAMFPAVSSAMYNAQVVSMQMVGRNLVNVINSESLAREANGMMPLWPQENPDCIDGDSSDISSKIFASSTEYFNELFDTKNSGTANYAPYVDPSWIKGLNPADWIIVSGYSDEIGNFPVLISANADVSAFPTRGSVDTSVLNGRLKINKTTKLGNRTVIVVMSSGEVKALKARDFTLMNVFGCATVNIPAGTTLRYLKP